MVRAFNDQLRPEGWMLVEVEKIAGRPRFVARAIGELGGRSVMRARSVADALDAAWMQKEIERLENAVDRDPALAIGTAKPRPWVDESGQLSVATTCRITASFDHRAIDGALGAQYLQALAALIAHPIQLLI